MPSAPVIVISGRDNVATALRALIAGESIAVADGTLTVRDSVGSGHKIALRHITEGEPVIKYGSPIGHATCDIEPGAHVHTHNVASDRGRGDLASGVETQR